MAVDPGIPLRADARRNRDQILAAAREMFAAQGVEAPMEEIARRAGVGVGTLYRRFPDREALVRAVARESFAQLLDDARAAVAEESTAWGALVRLVNQCSDRLRITVQLIMISTRARDLLRDDPKTAELRDALIAEIAEIAANAQSEGSMRADIGAGDVAVLVALTLRQPQVGIASDRAIAIMLDGLRPQTTSDLPGSPLSVDDLWYRQPEG